MKYDKNRIHPRLQLKIVYDSSDRELCVPLRVWKRSGVYGKHAHLIYISYVMRTTEIVYDDAPKYVRFTEDVACKEDLSVEIPIYIVVLEKENLEFVCIKHFTIYQMFRILLIGLSYIS